MLISRLSVHAATPLPTVLACQYSLTKDNDPKDIDDHNQAQLADPPVGLRIKERFIASGLESCGWRGTGVLEGWGDFSGFDGYLYNQLGFLVHTREAQGTLYQMILIIMH